MKIADEKLNEILIGPGHISRADFKSALKEAKENKKDLTSVLIEKDLITDEHLGRLIAEELGYSFINLRKEKIDEEVLNLIPELVARSKGVIAFAKKEKGIKVGMINPKDLKIKHLIEKRAGQKVLPYFITKRDLQIAFSQYKPSLKDEFEKVFQKIKDKTLIREQRDTLTIKMVDLLLQYGYQNKASDVHIEPHLKKVLIRFRIDGVLHKVLEIPKDLHELILMRIKILAKMRTDEHRAAQDGKIRFKTLQEMVDVRVSVVPIVEGENIVMRLLSSKSREFSLTGLGLSEVNFKKVQRAIKSPHGMILVTGPTGCGKTTTLYAIMRILNKPRVHIATIEDPVEYDIEGVSQIQVNPKTNLTFAKGLRAIVRQDPDIIMVGEIRDEETAGIAVNSALTGHLVLSTLHTNDAPTTLPRLLDMGIEPFLVASTVNVAIAQRLVRKICEKCRASRKLTDSEKRVIENDSHLKDILKNRGYKNLNKVLLFEGRGCKVCGNTGFSGRTGIFEVLEMADNIKDLIIKHASSDEIMKIAQKNGMTTMFEDGIEKVFQAMTTLEEILRVTKE